MILLITYYMALNAWAGFGIMMALDADGSRLRHFRTCPDRTGVVKFLTLQAWPLMLLFWWVGRRVAS